MFGILRWFMSHPNLAAYSLCRLKKRNAAQKRCFSPVKGLICRGVLRINIIASKERWRSGRDGGLRVFTYFNNLNPLFLQYTKNVL